MEPTWASECGTAQLWLGDCRDVLPELPEFEAVIVDPVWPNAPDGMFAGIDDPQGLLADTLALMGEAVRRVVVVMRTDSDPRFLVAVPKRFVFFRTATLQYAAPGYIGRKLGGMEVAYAFGEPICSREGQRVIPGEAPKAQPGECCREHPCARALSHMAWLVRWYSEVDETVCDPFMGSGTTGVACVRMGRRFIGIEKEPKYFDIAVQRIEAELKRYPLFEQPPVRQMSLLER